MEPQVILVAVIIGLLTGVGFVLVFFLVRRIMARCQESDEIERLAKMHSAGTGFFPFTIDEDAQNIAMIKEAVTPRSSSPVPSARSSPRIQLLQQSGEDQPPSASGTSSRSSSGKGSPRLHLAAVAAANSAAQRRSSPRLDTIPEASAFVPVAVPATSGSPRTRIIEREQVIGVH
jgi:hypothetical protein